MEEAVEQRFERVEKDITEIKEIIERHRVAAESAINDARALTHQTRNDMNQHNLEDAKMFTHLTSTCVGLGSTCERINNSITERDKKLYGDDGQGGIIKALNVSIGSIERSVVKLQNKIAMAIGGGIVIVFLLDKFSEKFSIFK